MEDDNYNFEKQLRLLDHVFLPRRLLQQSSRAQVVEDEPELLLLIAQGIHKFADQVENATSYNKIKQLFRTWKSIQRVSILDAERIQKSMRQLGSGDSLAFYVRDQNSCILISIPSTPSDPDFAVLSTFPASLKSADVIASGQDNTITSTYPAISVQIPQSTLLRSKAFADQLICLCDNQFEIAMSKSEKAGRQAVEVREVAEPILVTEWLTATLTDANSESYNSALISKKVRDDVLWKNTLLPFRRSGMYMSIKVVLQLSLVREFGEVEGTFIYKSIMVQFLTSFLSLPVSMDLGIQMIAKVSRRIFKLDKYYRQHVDLLFANLYSEKFNTFCRTQATFLTNARDKLDQIWNKIIRIEKEKSLYSLPAVNYKEGIHHLLLSSKSFLNREKYGMKTPKSHPGSLCPPRLTSKFDFPYADFLETANEKNLGVAFHDVGNWIRKDFEKIPNSGTYSKNVRDLFTKYFQKGKSYYKNDPVGYSCLVLNCFKIVQVFDRVATLTHPMLFQHRSGVNISCLSYLLLPAKSDLQLARQIESYFNYRDSNASHPSLIEESKVTQLSFATRFAKDDHSMIQLKSKMVEIQEFYIQKKLAELRELRLRCDSLKSRIAAISCDYYEETIPNTGAEAWRTEKRTRTVHASWCGKCNLERQKSACTSEIYEKALPEQDHLRSAISFEFLIPPEIACLRDILFVLASVVCIEEGKHIVECPTMFNSWTSYKQISDLAKSTVRPNSVHLGSTLKSYMSSHYGREIEQHVDTHKDNDYIVNNAYNCTYGSSTTILLSHYGHVVRKPFIHTVQLASPYSNLQWALDSTDHSENQVLARQADRHPQLDPHEFKVFGSLRAGNRLQLRNIYKALVEGSLNFQTESVFALICQCIWEAGPKGLWELLRDSHLDLEDSNFGETFSELLSSVLDSNSENWTQPLYLITIINLSTRILSFANDPSIQLRAAAVIRKCRKVAKNWVRKIKSCLNKMLQAPTEEVNKIRQLLILCASAVALTFSADPECLPSLLTSSEDQVDWLHSVVWTDENTLLNSSVSMPFLFQNILRSAQRTALSLEDYLNRKLSHSSEGLTKFVRNHWSGSSGRIENKWKQLPSPRRQVWYSEWSNPEDQEPVTVEVDVVIGTFLVNGNPIGRLPQAITNHEDFKRVFQRSVFEVHSEGPGIFVTSNPIGSTIYKFCLGESNKIAIIEFQQNEEFQLFPTQQFDTDIPILLVDSYSHWWNKRYNKIVFRPILFSDKEFTTRIDYHLDLSTRTLTDVKSGKNFIDASHQAFLPIAKIIEKLEDIKYIHLMFSTETNEAFIELPRMGLNFKINQQNEIISHEFSGKRVASNQSINTLIGLKQSLLLEGRSSDDNPIILVPHGKVVLLVHNELHQTIKIDYSVSSTDNNKYFAYEMDSRLRILKAGQNHTGWLYLAHLHAVTASPLPDPFTGLTGTESAMKILQSGHAWSSRPLNGTAISILQNISNLSPKREYYPQHLRRMQQVDWPAGLHSIAADDGFVLLVDKLISDSTRLAPLFTGEEDCSQKYSYSTWRRELSSRAYFRNMVYCGEQAKITQDFEPSCSVCLQSIKCESIKINLENEKMKNVRKLAYLGHKWVSAATMSDTTSILHELFLSSNLSFVNIRGMSFQGYSSQSNITDWLGLEFRNNWLDLYNFARKIGHSEELRSRWTMLLCSLAYNGESMNHLLLLHIVAVFPSKFVELNPPPHQYYLNTYKNDFNGVEILSEIRRHEIGVGQYLSSNRWRRSQDESDWSFENRFTAEYNALVKTEAESLRNKVQDEWPTSSCSGSVYSVCCPHINLSAAISGINSTLALWHTNYELKMFLNQVGASVNQIQETRIYPLRPISQHTTISTVKTTSVIGFYDILKLSENDNLGVEEDADAQEIFRTGCDRRAPAPLLTCKEDVSKNVEQLFPSPPSSFLLSKENTCPVKSFYTNKILESISIHKEEQLGQNHSTEIPKADDLVELREYYKERGCSLWNKIQNTIYQPDKSAISKALFAGGLLPRFTPTVFLPYICSRNTPETPGIMLRLQNFTGALCVTWTLEQRIIRCLRYLRSSTGMEVALEREILNPGHENWSPAERPEWLLLELEMDMMIRPIQITVAEQMLNPPDGNNALMQLNMGEGKTAVIIPLLVVAIADGTRLCRVTVLRSLHVINSLTLISKLGGLLNRRVYNFPCRRDMKIGEAEVKQMLNLYKECLQKGGVVLTRPEHRLSLELKTFENCRAGTTTVAKEAVNLLQWLKDNARDVLDESDEILHAKYQLVYTMGDQLPIDGTSLRWTVAQDVLKLAQNHMQSIVTKFGCNSAEYHPEPSKPEAFQHFRLLSTEFEPYRAFCEEIVKDFIEGKSSQTPFPQLRSVDKTSMVHFLTLPSTDQEIHRGIINLFEGNSNALNIVLILRGILACGVLQLTLSKRWRVNYGVNPTGERMMAVPFRAKDVAAEKTEFGHPDVAILYTLLSYYYSGLLDNQIDQCFEFLLKCQNPELEYEQWVACVPSIDVSIAKYNGVNLSDFEQKMDLIYPAFRKNVSVINFWLNHAVFPVESKQFEGKMVCTAWDLCRDDGKYPVTGFSGTNDSELLLPLSIAQKDLPQLQGTNGQVVCNLLLPENNNYDFMPSGTTSSEILKKITQNLIRVLLDVGALILELTNKEVAEQWLEFLPPNQVDAVVYFDEFDRLVVVNRQKRTNIFETSSYRERLDRCAVYLDDIHTRGTDLKMPSGFKACVTLGNGVTKDKLVQGCMRMRMLGQGHTVHFLASQEVHNSIIAFHGPVKTKITTENVLKWAMDNSCIVTRDNMLHWAAAGYNFAQKQSASLIFKQCGDDQFRTASGFLGHQCTDKEVLKLMSYYGGCRREEFVTGIAKVRQKQVEDELKEKLNQSSNYVNSLKIMKSSFNEIGSEIIKKCQKFVPNVKIFAQLLEEEQERELSPEVTEERQKPRQPPAKPNQHSLHEHVSHFVQTGEIRDPFKWVVRLPLALEKTSVKNILQENAWGENIWATKDFVQVTVDASGGRDGVQMFLRTPTWIAVDFNGEKIKTLVLLSPYEANRLIPIFRKGGTKAVLRMFLPKLRRSQDILFYNQALQIPSRSSTSIVNKNFTITFAHLSMFAGALYFEDENEQKVFCQVFGYAPHPLSQEEQAAFDRGEIQHGFITPEFRPMLRGELDLCKFQSSPTDLIRKIVEMRHGSVPPNSHIYLVVLESKQAIQ